MHAPPADRREPRRILAAVLALFTMTLAVFAIMATRPTEANAQELPVIAELDGQCVSGAAVFHFEITNTRTTTFTFEYQLSALGPGGGTQYNETSLTPGQFFEATFQPEQAPAAGSEWTVYFSDADLGYVPVGQSNTVANPCEATTTVPPEVTYEVTCQKNAAGEPETVRYAPTVKNPNTVPMTYTLVRSWNDGRADVVTENVAVAAGATVSGEPVDYSSADGLTGEWTHTLTIRLGGGVVGAPITRQNPCSSTPTPTDPPAVTYDVTCQKNTAGEPESVVYALSIENPNTVAVTYTVVRSWDDERDDVVTENVTVAAGATVSGDAVDYSSADGIAAEWTHTLTIKVGDAAVGTPVTKENPCVTPPADTTTTATPSTDTTTSTDIAAASNNSGGLATTGVAIAAVLGVGLVLFANGAGLLRLVRKGEHE